MARVVTGSILYAVTYNGTLTALLQDPSAGNEKNAKQTITTTEELIRSIPAGDERIVPLKALAEHMNKLLPMVAEWKAAIEGSSKAIEDALAKGNDDAKVEEATNERSAALAGIEALNTNVSASMSAYLQAEESAIRAYFRGVAVEVGKDVTRNPLFNSNPMYRDVSP